jgi:hypothetical protein
VTATRTTATTTFGRFAPAEVIIKKSLESLDTCIALRRLLTPRYGAWLARARASQ